MQHDFYTFMNQLNHTALDATRQLIEINHQSGKKMVKSQFDALDLYLDSGAKLARLNREYDDMPGYLAAQNSIMREYADHGASAVKETLTILSETREELAQWAEQSTRQLADLIKPAEKAA